MRSIVNIASFSLCGILICCSPVSTVSRYGIKATIVDAESKQPLGQIVTRIGINGSAFDRTSSSAGVIAVRADRKLRLSWLGGPAVYDVLETSIEIEPRGYQLIRFRWTPILPHRSSPDISESGGIVSLGTIEMKKR